MRLWGKSLRVIMEQKNRNWNWNKIFLKFFFPSFLFLLYLILSLFHFFLCPPFPFLISYHLALFHLVTRFFISSWQACRDHGLHTVFVCCYLPWHLTRNRSLKIILVWIKCYSSVIYWSHKLSPISVGQWLFFFKQERCILDQDPYVFSYFPGHYSSYAYFYSFSKISCENTSRHFIFLSQSLWQTVFFKDGHTVMFHP